MPILLLAGLLLPCLGEVSADANGDRCPWPRPQASLFTAAAAQGELGVGMLPRTGAGLLQVQAKEKPAGGAPSGSAQLGAMKVLGVQPPDTVARAHLFCTPAERAAAATAIALLLAGPGQVAFPLARVAAGSTAALSRWVNIQGASDDRLLAPPPWSGDPCILGVTKFAWACVLTGVAMLSCLILIPCLLSVSRRRPPGQAPLSCLERSPHHGKLPSPPPGAAAEPPPQHYY